MAFDPNRLVSLDTDGFHEVCRQTHPLWHQGLGFDAYVGRLEDAFDRMAGEMRYVGLRSDNGSVAASARLLELRLRLDAELVPTCGIAAVFVAEEMRGQGWGTHLIRTILADAAGRGQQLALLFSDIGPAYYERLGFRACSARDWHALAEALPASGAFATREAAPGDRALLDVFNGYADRQKICPHRTAAWWSYFRWWRGARPDLVLLDDGHEVGYVTVRTDADHLHVFEWVAPDVEPGRVWATLRREAIRVGRHRLGGWLQPGRSEPWMQVTDRLEAIPMLASTSAEGFVIAAPAVFEELDHF